MTNNKRKGSHGVYLNEKKRVWYADARVVDKNGVKQRIWGFESKYKSDVDDWVAEKRAYFRKEYDVIQCMTVSEAIDKYIESLPRTKRHTRIEYKKRLSYRLDSVIDKVISRVTESDVNRLLKSIQEANLEHSTKHYNLRLLYRFFTFARKAKIYPIDLPETFFVVQEDFPVAKRYQFWTANEFYKFIAVVDISDISYLYFHILFFTGIRISELLGLTWGDIDLNHGTMNINKQLNVLKEITTPKTASSVRYIPLTNNLLKIFKHYANIINPSDNMFVAPVVKQTIRRWLRMYAKKADVKPIKIHELRHSFATMCINELDIKITSLSELLGHSSPEVTLRVYAHAYKAKNNEAIQQLNALCEQHTNTVKIP